MDKQLLMPEQLILLPPQCRGNPRGALKDGIMLALKEVQAKTPRNRLRSSQVVLTSSMLGILSQDDADSVIRSPPSFCRHVI